MPGHEAKPRILGDEWDAHGDGGGEDRPVEGIAVYPVHRARREADGCGEGGDEAALGFEQGGRVADETFEPGPAPRSHLLSDLEEADRFLGMRFAAH